MAEVFVPALWEAQCSLLVDTAPADSGLTFTSPVCSDRLFVAQCLDRVEIGGLDGWEQPE